MTANVIEANDRGREHRSPAIELSTVLTPNRVTNDLNVSSKKRLLEIMSGLLLKDNHGLDRDTVFQILLERERLGSTGIGNGVALPHGRVNGIDQAIGAFSTLRNPLDYDSLDNQPVNMVFALLVPADAHEAHLKLLSHLAEMFNDAAFRDGLVQSSTPDHLYSSFLERDRPAYRNAR